MAGPPGLTQSEPSVNIPPAWTRSGAGVPTIRSVVLQIRDAVGEIRYRFRPVVHLRTGRVMALEVRACPAAGDLGHLRPVTGIAERLVQLDVRFAVEAVRRAAEYGTLLPLQLNLWADTACAEHDPLGPLVCALADAGYQPAQVTVRLVVSQEDPVPRDIARGLARLRAAGFGVAMDTAAHPMTTLLDAGADVLLLSARHTGGLPEAADSQAVLAGSVALAAHTGATLVADGCDTPEQVAALWEHGVDHVQGELLGPSRRRPHTQPVPAVVLDRLTRRGPTSEPPAGAGAPAGGGGAAAGPQRAVVGDLAHPAVTMPADTTGDAARAVFADRTELSSLVLVDEQLRPIVVLHRDRFMLAITGPFGHSLHARRPAAGLGEPPRTLGGDADLAEAIAMVADTPGHWMYDDIVIVDRDGCCRSVLRIGDLVRDLARRQEAFTALAHAR